MQKREIRSRAGGKVKGTNQISFSSRDNGIVISRRVNGLVTRRDVPFSLGESFSLGKSFSLPDGDSLGFRHTPAPRPDLTFFSPIEPAGDPLDSG